LDGFGCNAPAAGFTAAALIDRSPLNTHIAPSSGFGNGDCTANWIPLLRYSNNLGRKVFRLGVAGVLPFGHERLGVASVI